MTDWITACAAGTCVQVKHLPTCTFVKDEQGSITRFTPTEWNDFMLGVREGKFDRPAAASPSGDTGHTPDVAAPSEEEGQYVQQALHAADAGAAGHWPTVADVLADEVRRLRALLGRSTRTEEGTP